MKRALFVVAGIASFVACSVATAAPWTVMVPPGVYGRVAIGGYAEPPQVISPQPVMAVENGYGQVVEEVVDAAYATDQPPVYLWVPEAQRLHWAQYSRDYGAIGVPVYFVDDAWYRANVMAHNWTALQRSWTQQQWLDQDRLARDRLERARFEQQRYEQQKRWEASRIWRETPQQRAAAEARAQALGERGVSATLAASQPSGESGGAMRAPDRGLGGFGGPGGFGRGGGGGGGGRPGR